MPLIRVGLEKYLDGATRTHPSIVARIHSLSAGESEAAPPRTMVMPAGLQSGISVDLPAGTYLFEAYLPNGDVATQTATVHDGTNKPVLLQAAESRYEWLSWQHLVGETAAWSPPTLELAPQAVELNVVTSADPPTALPKALLDVWKGAPVGSLRWTPVGVPPRTDDSKPRVDPGLTAYLFGPGPWREDGRYYGLVPRPPDGPPLLSVLPLPWHQADMSGEAQADVLVDARDAAAKGRREWPVRVSVVVRDNVMASVFGYLASGDLPAAARVVETALQLLYGKVQNPLAAAGGAYILVRSAVSAQQRPVWEPWLRNLRNWFPWLPDGAVLDGWAHLNGIGRPPNVKEAALAFVEAVNRGLPFYSAGVRLLFEGLTRVEASPDAGDRPADFAPAFEFVRRLALRVDVRQPFTVVRLG